MFPNQDAAVDLITAKGFSEDQACAALDKFFGFDDTFEPEFMAICAIEFLVHS